MSKLYSFDAGSFYLDDSVAELLKSKGAISLDFGTAAYINSEAMPSILADLLSPAEPNNTELEILVQQNQKVAAQNSQLAVQLDSSAAEIARLAQQLAVAQKTIETLKSSPQPADFDSRMKQAYEKLQKEFNALRTSSIEAITSLKVLEEENDQLHDELDKLKAAPKPVAAKAQQILPPA